MHKPAGMPSQKDKTGDKSILDLAEIYAKRKLQLLHRLDRPVSGLILLSKEKNFTQHFIKMQESGKVRKTYLAICAKGKVNKAGTWVDELSKDSRTKKAYIGKTAESKEVRLDYEVVQELENYLVLKIVLSSGRFHQIRAQLAHRKLFIKGDVKYGARRSNKDRSIYLHAYSISIPAAGPYEKVELKTIPQKGDTLWDLVFNGQEEKKIGSRKFLKPI